MKESYEIHPFAACWSKPDNYEEIKTSIKELGQLQAISLFEGKILDGVQRYRICCELGFEPQFETPEIKDPFIYVLAKNKNRRHITKGQIAMAVAKMSKLQHGSNQYMRKSGSVATTVEPTIAELAQQTGLSKSEIERAKFIHEKGSSELIEAVSNGGVSTDKARATVSKTAQKRPRKPKVLSRNKKESVNQRAQRRHEMLMKDHKPGRPFVGLTREEVDPDFNGTAIEWMDKYGHVQIMTKAELEADRKQAALMDRISALNDLREPLEKYLKTEPFALEVVEAWIGKSPERRRRKFDEMLSLANAFRDSIEQVTSRLSAQAKP